MRKGIVVSLLSVIFFQRMGPVMQGGRVTQTFAVCLTSVLGVCERDVRTIFFTENSLRTEGRCTQSLNRLGLFLEVSIWL